MQILVVIDSLPLLNSVVGMISETREGWTVGYIDNAPGAMALINAMKPNVLILEFQLWISSGLDVIQHIKKVVPYSKVAVVTGAPYQEYRNKSLVSGADFFFNLDCELEDFCRTLKRLGHGFAGHPDISEVTYRGAKPSIKGGLP